MAGNLTTTATAASVFPRLTAKQRAHVYSTGKRCQEVLCVCVTSLLMLVSLWRLVALFSWRAVPAVLAGAAGAGLLADLCSGVVHWVADTWGSVNIPLLGKHYLRPFREHHVDPTGITRHCFFETNGDNFMAALPVLLVLFYQLLTESDSLLQQHIGLLSFLYLFTVLVAFTNQIHKWSHTYIGLPATVRVLQRAGVILSREQHRHHHVAPHACSYCITTGWLNAPLDSVGFWRRAEQLVTRLTGAIPRSDDMMWARQSRL